MIKSIPRILIVEDDEEINKLLCTLLKNEGYDVSGVFSGTECILHLRYNKADIILLDLMIPGMSGEDTIIKIRQITKAPVIVVSAKTSKSTKIELLNKGADDFICKPFEPEEVAARVNSNIRRYLEFGHSKEDDNILKFKDITLDKENKRVKVCGKLVVLTAREYKILEILLNNPDKIFSKANLFESVWGEEFLGYDNTVNVHMSRLRNKLNSVSIENDKDYIETIWGMGYRLKK